MKKNVCAFDKLSRVITGSSLIAFSIYTNEAFGFLGIIPLMTGVLGFCPVYRLTNFSTCKQKEK